MKMDHEDIHNYKNGSQRHLHGLTMKKMTTKQMDAKQMPLNATFFHTLGLVIIMPGAVGQIGHPCTEKNKLWGFMVFMASLQIYV